MTRAGHHSMMGGKAAIPLTFVDGAFYDQLGAVRYNALYSRIDDYLPIIGGHSFTWKWGTKVVPYCYLVLYNANKEHQSGWFYSPNNSSGQRTVSISSSFAFVRFSVDINYKMEAFLRDETTGEYIVREGLLLPSAASRGGYKRPCVKRSHRRSSRPSSRFWRAAHSPRTWEVAA